MHEGRCEQYPESWRHLERQMTIAPRVSIFLFLNIFFFFNLGSGRTDGYHHGTNMTTNVP